MAIKYLDINQESNLIPVTEGNFLETVKDKIISIIEKIEEIIDKFIFKLREEGFAIKKYKETLLKHKYEVNDIELDFLIKDTDYFIVVLQSFEIKLDNIDDMNKAIESLKKYDADYISSNTEKSTIGEFGGIEQVIQFADTISKGYLNTKARLRNTKREIKGQRKEISKEAYNTAMHLCKLYASVLSRVSLTEYRYYHAAITKAIDRVKTLKEFATCDICDEFNAFMESNFGLNEATATDYKTIDISDCDGVDITDTISGNFDNWEGIIPDNTIGDITAEFDDFLESTFGSDDLEFINEAKILKTKTDIENALDEIERHQGTGDHILSFFFNWIKIALPIVPAKYTAASIAAGMAAKKAVASGAGALGTIVAARGAAASVTIPVATVAMIAFVACSCCTRIFRLAGSISDKKVKCNKILASIDKSIITLRKKGGNEKQIKRLEEAREKVNDKIKELNEKYKGKSKLYQNIHSESTGLSNITAEFDEYLESSGLLTEGMFRDNQISVASHGDYGDFEIDIRDIIGMHDAMMDIKEQLYAIEYLKNGYLPGGKTRHVNSKIYFSKNKTRFSPDELDKRAKWLEANYKKIEAAYEKAGGDQTYYAAMGVQVQQDIAMQQRMNNVIRVTK